MNIFIERNVYKQFPVRDKGTQKTYKTPNNFQLCIPQKGLANPHFKYKLNISKTEL